MEMCFFGILDNERIKNLLRTVRSFVVNVVYWMLWKLCRQYKSERCLNDKLRENKIVVSLTSFPGRIHLVHKTIQTILNQYEIKPDTVELWLAKEQFPRMESELPRKLLELKEYGLHICWCEDIRSYKKLIPSLKKHHETIIVTADDDVYYRRDWLGKLYDEYIRNPGYIYCHRATKFIVEKNEFKAIGGGKEYYKRPSYLNKLVGIGGVLYPPNVLHCMVTEQEVFMKYAPTNDDIWFWFMAIKNHVRVCVVKNHNPRPITTLGAEKTEKLSVINDQGEKLFWRQFFYLLELYPDVKKKLLEEAKKCLVNERTC